MAVPSCPRSVCACGELWAIIMDAGTGYTQQVGWLPAAETVSCLERRCRLCRGCAAPRAHRAVPAPSQASCSCTLPPAHCQVYKVAQRQFLPKEWIMEQVRAAAAAGPLGGCGAEPRGPGHRPYPARGSTCRCWAL